MDRTARLDLPMLHVGQAAKEWMHNEALATIDIVMHAVVEEERSTPPDSPLPGGCWLVGTGATGAWRDRDGAIAGWTEAGWRFAELPQGAAVWDGGSARTLRRTGDGWERGVVRATMLMLGNRRVLGKPSPLAMPGGGAVVDAEARQSIEAITRLLEAQGIATIEP